MRKSRPIQRYRSRLILCMNKKVKICLDFSIQIANNLLMLFYIKNTSNEKNGYIIYVHGLRVLIGTKGRTLEPVFIPLMSTIYIQVSLQKVSLSNHEITQHFQHVKRTALLVKIKLHVKCWGQLSEHSDRSACQLIFSVKLQNNPFHKNVAKSQYA